MPIMTHWTEDVRYSLAYDEIMARISGFDDRSQEHFMIIEAGKGYRDRRFEALERIQQSIEVGDPPGEVSS